MTHLALTGTLAMLPLAFKLGQGGKSWSPLTSTFFTSPVVPVVDTIVDEGHSLGASLPWRIRRLVRRAALVGNHPVLGPVPIAGATD